MESLVLIGACLTLAGSTRPGSGSEHHLSHYFEITGIVDARTATKEQIGLLMTNDVKEVQA